MKVDPGELNRKIKVVKVKSKGKNANGFPIKEDETVRTPWAKVTYLSGTEAIKAGADFSEIKARFLVRHSKKAPIDGSMFVVYDGKRFNIEYVNDYNQEHVYDEIWGTWKENANGI